MLRIITDRGELDTNGTIDVSFNYQLEDIVNINKRKSSYSKTIELPGTPNNNKFFKQIFDFSIDKQINVKQRINCTVLDGNENVLKGYLKLLNFKNTKGELLYEVNITQDSQNIWEDMNDLDLSQLDFSRFNHIRSRANIKNSWEDSIHINGNVIDAKLGQGYVYPTINYGNFLNLKTQQFVAESVPALYVKEIWDTMFNSLGYKYESDFINSEYFKRLIIPGTKENLQLTEEAITKREVLVGVDKDGKDGSFYNTPTDYIGLTDYYADKSGWSPYFKPILGDEETVFGESQFSDPSNQWNNAIGGAFVADKDGFYDVRINLMMRIQAQFIGAATPRIRWASNNFAELEWSYKISIIRNNGNSQYIQPLDNTGAPTSYDWAPVDDNWRSYNGTIPPIFDKEQEEFFINEALDNIFLSAGDQVFIEVKLRNPDSKTFNAEGEPDDVEARIVTARNIGEQYTTFEVKLADTTPPANEMINMNQILPRDYKMQDFFKSIIDSFNLLLLQQEDGSILIEPREAYFKSRQKVKDWDKKLDDDVEIKATPLHEMDVNSYLFTYKEDKDYLNTKYTEDHNLMYAERTIDTLDEFSKRQAKTEIKLSPTPISGMFASDRPSPVFVEKKDDNSYKAMNPKPRMLFYGGTIPCNTYYIVDFQNDPTASGTQKYAYCGMWDNPTNPKWSLEFGNSLETYHNTSKYPLNNLYNMYHKRYIDNLIDRNNVMIEADFYLNSTDIHTHDFRDVIFLQENYWRIIDIKDYNPNSSDTTTKVRLVKIIDFDTYNEFNESIPFSNNSCPANIQLVRDPNFGYIYKSDEGEIDEDCCNAIGGQYINGVCKMKNVVVLDDDIAGGGGVGTLDEETTRLPNTDFDVAPKQTKYTDENKNNNTYNSTDTIVKGSYNYVQTKEGSGSIVLGNFNTTNNNKSLIVGDGNSIDNAFILGDNNSLDAIGATVSNTKMVVGDNISLSIKDLEYTSKIDNVLIGGSNINIGNTTFTDGAIISPSLDLSGATISGFGLSEVLSDSNITGGNNILMSDSDRLQAFNGTSFLDMRYQGNNGRVYMQGNSSFLLLRDGTNQFIDGSPASNIEIQSTQLLKLNISTAINTVGGGTYSRITVISSDNSTVSTSGTLSNTAIIGGNNITADKSNTLYTEHSVNTGVHQFAEYTVATLPLASDYSGGQIMVTDEVGGYTPAFSDGTNWRRVRDSVIVS